MWKWFQATAPEPVQDASYVLVARGSAAFAGFALIFNLILVEYLIRHAEAGARIWVGRTYQALTVPAYVSIVLIGLLVGRLRSTASLRRATYAIAALACWVAVASLWVNGSLTSWNYLWLIGYMLFFRIYFDVGLGRFTFACAAFGHFGLVVLEVAGLVPAHPRNFDAALSSYASPGGQIVSGLYRVDFYVVVFMLANYVANRIRGHEAELRRLNGELASRLSYQERQLELAGTLQELLVPTVRQGRAGPYDYAFDYVPQENVAGDWIQLWHDGTRLYAVVGDVAGKGPAASLAATAIVAAFGEVRNRGGDLEACLLAANRSVHELFQERLYSTFTALIAEPDGRIRIATGGHVGWLHVGGNGHRSHLTRCQLLGQDRETTLRWREVPLAVGELMVAHSDGIGEGRAFVDTAGRRLASAGVTTAEAAVRTVYGLSGDATDDRCVLALRYAPAVPTVA